MDASIQTLRRHLMELAIEKEEILRLSPIEVSPLQENCLRPIACNLPACLFGIVPTVDPNATENLGFRTVRGNDSGYRE
jgi:hypothetical protein